MQYEYCYCCFLFCLQQLVYHIFVLQPLHPAPSAPGVTSPTVPSVTAPGNFVTAPAPPVPGVTRPATRQGTTSVLLVKLLGNSNSDGI